jgi:hypothetical protein
MESMSVRSLGGTGWLLLSVYHLRKSLLQFIYVVIHPENCVSWQFDERTLKYTARTRFRGENEGDLELEREIDKQARQRRVPAFTAPVIDLSQCTFESLSSLLEGIGLHLSELALALSAVEGYTDRTLVHTISALRRQCKVSKTMMNSEFS